MFRTISLKIGSKIWIKNLDQKFGSKIWIKNLDHKLGQKLDQNGPWGFFEMDQNDVLNESCES